MKKRIIVPAVAAVVAACLAGAGFFIGRAVERRERIAERDYLIQVNRSSMEKLDVKEGTSVYVIGHRSPDTDTVCSAIAYARFLSLLGYRAEAAVTETVNRETAFVLKRAGIEVPPVLGDASGKNVVLVDHSEYAQAAAGMEGAHIVGIIDHHGIGSVLTGHQVAYSARPIGSTSTIIWLDYLNYGFEIRESTAFLMLCAILSDTDNLTGSTTTDADRQALEYLSRVAEVGDVDALFREMHAEKLSYDGMTDLDILFSDYKEYEAGGKTFGIGLVSAIDEETARELAERMKNVLPQACESKNVDYMYVSVGMRENGEKIDRVICDGQSREVFEKAFPGYDEFDGTSFVFRTGIGRKTIFVPGLTDYLVNNPQK